MGVVTYRLSQGVCATIRSRSWRWRLPPVQHQKGPNKERLYCKCIYEVHSKSLSDLNKVQILSTNEVAAGGEVHFLR